MAFNFASGAVQLATGKSFSLSLLGRLLCSIEWKYIFLQLQLNQHICVVPQLKNTALLFSLLHL